MSLLAAELVLHQNMAVLFVNGEDAVPFLQTFLFLVLILNRNKIRQYIRKSTSDNIDLFLGHFLFIYFGNVFWYTVFH